MNSKISGKRHWMAIWSEVLIVYNFVSVTGSSKNLAAFVLFIDQSPRNVFQTLRLAAWHKICCSITEHSGQSKLLEFMDELPKGSDLFS